MQTNNNILQLTSSFLWLSRYLSFSSFCVRHYSVMRVEQQLELYVYYSCVPWLRALRSLKFTNLRRVYGEAETWRCGYNIIIVLIMATNFEAEFPKQKGWYTLSELKYLSNSLGFDSSVFTKVIFSETKCLGTKGLSEKKFIEMLNLKLFDKYLDCTFNNKSAKYNVKTIKKALQLLRHRLVGFPELCQARMTYFLYENDDQLGMDADSGTILKALKLCDRMMSPVQLDKYLIDMSLSVQTPCRLQLFEFLELMSLTTKIDSIPMAKLADMTAEKDDYLQVIQTNEQKALDILDEQFKASQSVNKVVKNKQKTSTAVSRQSSVIQRAEHNSVAQDQAAELLSSVEISTAQLRLARSGHSILPPKQDDTRASTSLSFPHVTSQMGQRQGLKFQFRKLPLREVWHHRNSRSCGNDKETQCIKEHNHKQPGPVHKCSAKHTKAAAEDLISSSKLHSKLRPSVCSAGTTSSNASTRKVHSDINTASNHWVPCQTPLITEDEFNEQQYKIDDLKWDMLRKETACAKLKQCTSSTSIGTHNGKSHCDKQQYRKFATLPVMDVHTLSLSVLKVLNENEEHNQNPTTCSLVRSKSVNFKLS